MCSNDRKEIICAITLSYTRSVISKPGLHTNNNCVIIWHITEVHLEPIEFPGLFAFALVLGFCYRRTQRVGLSMVTHLAFNATGLLLVALS